MSEALAAYSSSRLWDIQDTLNALYQQLNHRFQTLVRVNEYAQQKSFQMVKIFIRIIKQQIETEADRCVKQKRILQSLKSMKLTKRVKKALTQLSFNIIQKLSPSLNPGIERHYTNLVKLHELYFESVHKEQYLKRIYVLKSANIVFKVELYVALLELLLEFVSQSFVHKMHATIEALNMLNKRTSGDVFAIKNHHVKDRQRELREYKSIRQRYKNKLPSLRCGFVEKTKEPGDPLMSQKTNISLIEILGSRPAYKPSWETKQQKQNDRQKYKTELSMQVPKVKNSLGINKYRSFKMFKDQQKKIKAKTTVYEQSKLKPLRLFQKLSSPVKVIQSKQDFMQEFSVNFAQLHKSLLLNDLDSECVKPEKKPKYSKAEWLEANQNKLLEVLAQKNSCIAREIANYASKHTKTVY